MFHQGDPVSEDKIISYDFKRKLSPDINLRHSHWESTVVLSWKDRAYLPKALGDGEYYKIICGLSLSTLFYKETLLNLTFSPLDVTILCTIKSNPSDLQLEDFEKVGYFFNTVGVKFLVAKYKVQVNIEVADILFEVWCNDIKLSEDQRIQVEWKEGAEVGRPLAEEERVGGSARDIWDG